MHTHKHCCLPMLISAIIFLAIAGIHICRIVMGWDFQIGECELPVWGSGVAAAIMVGMAVWNFCNCRCCSGCEHKGAPKSED